MWSRGRDGEAVWPDIFATTTPLATHERRMKLMLVTAGPSESAMMDRSRLADRVGGGLGTKGVAASLTINPIHKHVEEEENKRTARCNSRTGRRTSCCARSTRMST